MTLTGNEAGGYKATLNNPNVSQEAKDNAQSILDDNDVQYADDSKNKEKNPGNVIGGIKAAINNPNVSEEKKDELQERLENETA